MFIDLCLLTYGVGIDCRWLHQAVEIKGKAGADRCLDLRGFLIGVSGEDVDAGAGAGAAEFAAEAGLLHVLVGRFQIATQAFGGGSFDAAD